MRNFKKHGATFGPSGDTRFRVTRDLGVLQPYRAETGVRGVIGALATVVRGRLHDDGRPEAMLASWRMSQLFSCWRRGERIPVGAKTYLGRLLGMGCLTGELSLRRFRPATLHPERLLRLRQLIRDGVPLGLLVPEFGGQVWEFGVAGHKVITTVGAEFLVDAWQGAATLEDQKFHGLGLGSTAAVIADTDIETELTTQYISDNVRATGSLTEASSKVFRTVGTNTVDAAAAVTEHGILSSATVGSGTLWDRTVFSVVNLANGDSLESTYDMTASDGG